MHDAVELLRGRCHEAAIVVLSSENPDSTWQRVSFSAMNLTQSLLVASGARQMSFRVEHVKTATNYHQVQALIQS